uniref:Uncharacterized protein n=1 Tax=Cacopsylla melanoneura TaxID=428564 RepID=A0A8D8YGQ7_9HEMI
MASYSAGSQRKILTRTRYMTRSLVMRKETTGLSCIPCYQNWRRVLRFAIMRETLSGENGSRIRFTRKFISPVAQSSCSLKSSSTVSMVYMSFVRRTRNQ